MEPPRPSKPQSQIAWREVRPTEGEKKKGSGLMFALIDLSLTRPGGVRIAITGKGHQEEVLGEGERATTFGSHGTPTLRFSENSAA
jgi:hypothetical protein